MTRNNVFMLLLALLWSALSVVVVSSAAFVIPTPQTKHASFLLLLPTKTKKVNNDHHHNFHHQYHHNVLPPPSCRFSRRTCPSFPLYMAAAWGPEPIWKSATIVENKPACPSGKSVSLVIEVDTDTASQYTIPGQYVQVRPLDDTTTKPLFLAMASAPKNNDENDDNENDATTLFEFIIKKTDGNEWITSLTKNKSNEDAVVVQVSQVLGKGFPVDENLNGFKYDFPTQNILLFATGSGIAPIKAAMEFPGFLKNNNGRTCRLYYGEQTADDLCCTTLFQSWEDAGYQVVPVLSQEEATTTTSPTSTSARCGYVQNALEEDGVPIPRNSGALLCGHKTMAESVSEILRTAGVFEGRILTNF